MLLTPQDQLRVWLTIAESICNLLSHCRDLKAPVEQGAKATQILLVIWGLLKKPEANHLDFNNGSGV